MACVFPAKEVDWINIFQQHLQVKCQPTLVKLSGLLCNPPNSLLPGAAQMPRLPQITSNMQFARFKSLIQS